MIELFTMKKTQKAGKQYAKNALALGTLSLLLCVWFANDVSLRTGVHGFILSLPVCILAGLGFGSGVRGVIVLRNMQSTKYIVFARIGILLSIIAAVYLITL